MATEMLAEVRVQDPRMTRIPAAQPLYTATATYKDEGRQRVARCYEADEFVTVIRSPHSHTYSPPSMTLIHLANATMLRA